MKDNIAIKLRSKGIEPKDSFPKHVAVTVGGVGRWTRTYKKDPVEAYAKMLAKIKDMIRYQTCFDIPIVTLFVVNSKVSEQDDFSEQMDALGDFFGKLVADLNHMHQKFIAFRIWQFRGGLAEAEGKEIAEDLQKVLG